MTIRCCYGCDKRYVGCHSVCKDYINEKKSYDLKKNKEFKAKLGAKLNRNYIVDAVQRTRRKK